MLSSRFPIFRRPRPPLERDTRARDPLPDPFAGLSPVELLILLMYLRG